MRERRCGGLVTRGALLRPGEISLITDGSPLMTVVSFGVVVCLWETEGKAGLMCHFVEPAIYDATRATARYGNVALPQAVEWMRQVCPRGFFEAQVFGGAACVPGDVRGARNLEMARRILDARAIPVVSEDVGGNKGRKIVFDPRSGHVVVIKVHQLRREDWL